MANRSERLAGPLLTALGLCAVAALVTTALGSGIMAMMMATAFDAGPDPKLTVRDHRADFEAFVLGERSQDAYGRLITAGAQARP